MAEETAGERTESATPRRREKARDKGQVARSQEVNSFFVLLAGAAGLVVLAPVMLDQLMLAARYLLGQAHFLAPDNMPGVRYLASGNLKIVLAVLLPVAGIIMLAGLAANLLQVGVRVTPAALEFKWNRLDPVGGVKRFFQKRVFFELIKNLLKVGKQEIKEEHKEVEGDPQIRARIRAQQMEMARKRMLADVPRADVVITNPTHLAVALKYESGRSAPVVLAKGADHVAQTIRDVARKSRVPVIENKPVARALYAEVEVGQPIPESLFQAVAEILAYVYRLKKA